MIKWKKVRYVFNHRGTQARRQQHKPKKGARQMPHPVATSAGLVFKLLKVAGHLRPFAYKLNHTKNVVMQLAFQYVQSAVGNFTV